MHYLKGIILVAFWFLASRQVNGRSCIASTQRHRSFSIHLLLRTPEWLLSGNGQMRRYDLSGPPGVRLSNHVQYIFSPALQLGCVSEYPNCLTIVVNLHFSPHYSPLWPGGAGFQSHPHISFEAISPNNAWTKCLAALAKLHRSLLRLRTSRRSRSRSMEH